MPKRIRSLYTDPLYRHSLALMLNSAIGAFFGFLFWTAAAMGHVKEGTWNSSEAGWLDQ
jgi:hypothetical protein